MRKDTILNIIQLIAIGTYITAHNHIIGKIALLIAALVALYDMVKLLKE